MVKKHKIDVIDSKTHLSNSFLSEWLVTVVTYITGQQNKINDTKEAYFHKQILIIGNY